MDTTTTVSSSEAWREGFELLTANVNFSGVDERVEKRDEYGHCECYRHYDYEDDILVTCLDSSCFNFVARTECVRCPSKKCNNQRFQNKDFKLVEVRPTPNEGHGLFAL